MLTVKGNGNSSGWVPRLMSMSQANQGRKTGASYEPAVSREEMSSAPLRASHFFFFFGIPPPHTHTIMTLLLMMMMMMMQFPTALFHDQTLQNFCREEILTSTSVAKTTKPQWRQQLSFGCWDLTPAAPLNTTTAVCRGFPLLSMVLPVIWRLPFTRNALSV